MATAHIIKVEVMTSEGGKEMMLVEGHEFFKQIPCTDSTIAAQ